MEQTIDKELIRWKQDKNRKILLQRGARQVGKTHPIRKLGHGFKNFIEVNFEETPEGVSWPVIFGLNKEPGILPAAFQGPLL